MDEFEQAISEFRTKYEKPLQKLGYDLGVEILPFDNKPFGLRAHIRIPQKELSLKDEKTLQDLIISPDVIAGEKRQIKIRFLYVPDFSVPYAGKTC